MVKDKAFVFQIVGYQNSGKTTLTEKVVHALSEAGKKVVVLKHHGHGGRPAIAEEKDSSRYVNAGAFASIVEGEGRLVLHAEKQSWSLEEEIQIASSLDPDLILIEGHKKAEYPKAVLIRSKEDLNLLEALTEIEAVFYWEKQLDCDGFHIHDVAGEKWLVSYLFNKIDDLARSSDF